MRKTFSIYEAKARLSEILRTVRERGESVVISYHGRPVAEIRPFNQEREGGLEARIAALETAGVVHRSTRQGHLRAVARRPGSLERFLQEREG